MRLGPGPPLIQINVPVCGRKSLSFLNSRRDRGKAGTETMLRHLLRILVVYIVVVLMPTTAAFADDGSTNRAIQEEVWAIPVTLPTIAYVVRPVGDGPFPLVIMNHGVSTQPAGTQLLPTRRIQGRRDVVRAARLHGCCTLRFRIRRGRAAGRTVPRQARMKLVPTTRWRRKMAKQRSLGESNLLTAMLILLLLDLGMAAASAQPAKPDGGPPNEKSANEKSANEKSARQEFAPRGQRPAREIKYSDWRKTCFKAHETKMVCRTSITGTFETGQSAVRINLIEREGEKASRLQLFLPVGLYLQAGVKITIDQGSSYQNSLHVVSYQHLHRGRRGRSQIAQGNGDRRDAPA